MAAIRLPETPSDGEMSKKKEEELCRTMNAEASQRLVNSTMLLSPI